MHNPIRTKETLFLKPTLSSELILSSKLHPLIHELIVTKATNFPDTSVQLRRTGISSANSPPSILDYFESLFLTTCMRHLNVQSLKLEEFYGDDIPFYAILSYTWEKEEITFTDLSRGTQQIHARLKKISVRLRLGSGKQSRIHLG